MGKVITVWGSPGSGKSMFSCILAKALTRDKRKAIIINAEISVPMLPVWLPEQIIQTNASVGQVLSSVEIDTSLVAGHVTVLKSYPFIGVMGYAAGENPLSYPEVKYAMVLQLVNAAARLVDFVILDCSSNMTNVFTPAAIESGDLVIRILTPDLKGVNYLKAHQPLLGDGRFHYDQHMTFAGMARPFHALDEMGHIIGGWDGLLPYGKEIDRCATEGGMFQAIKYCNPKYTASLNKVLDALEQMEQRMMETKPSILRRKLPMNNLNDIFFAPAANQDLTYEQILEDVQRYFAENHAATIAEAGDGNTDRASSLLKELMVQYIVKRKYAIEGLTTEELCEKLYEDMAGYSFLKKWIYKPGIEEVNINAYNDIEVIEAGGRSVKIPDKFSSPQHAIDVVRRMLNACGMVIDDTMPSVIGFLDKNVRISVDKTPIVDPEVGINASIRIVNQQTVSAQKLLDSGSATAEMLHFLTACIRYGVSVCIAGATGSGKTTIMAWLLSQVPDNRRLITIEEGSREFDLVKRDENGNILNSVVHLLTRPSENPSLNINQDFLLERVLRKHPDVIGVGEMRSAAESLSAAESSRTGHTVCTTIHSNSCASTYRRMMTLAKRKYMMGDDVLMQIMVEAYPIIVFTKQLEDRSRKIMEIIEGEGCEGERLIYRTLYSYNVLDNTVDADGRPLVVGRHKKVSEMSSSLQKRLLDNGISHKELDEFLEHDKEVLNGCRGFTSYASPSSPLDS